MFSLQCASAKGAVSVVTGMQEALFVSRNAALWLSNRSARN
jgi:hypothetical protein